MIIDTQQVTTEQLSETASRLPPLPQTTSRIISILGDPLFETGELIKVIALDSTLTARLLKCANSATNSRGREVASVGEAVVRLGSGAILVMALSSSAKPPADLDLTAFRLTVETYWQHCVGTVAAAEELNARRIARFGSGFSTAALLHDFGKLILSQHITAERLNQLATFHTSHPTCRPIDAERDVLGVDHAVAGAIVARNWNLPETIVTAIENHHSPVDWNDNLTNGIILANQIAQENAGHTDFVWEADDNVANAMLALDLEDRQYEAAAKESQNRFEHLIELFA